jgi:hypothetical protein
MRDGLVVAAFAATSFSVQADPGRCPGLHLYDAPSRVETRAFAGLPARPTFEGGVVFFDVLSLEEGTLIRPSATFSRSTREKALDDQVSRG